MAALLLGGTVLAGATALVLTVHASEQSSKAKSLGLLVDNRPLANDVKISTSFAPIVKKVVPSVVKVEVSIPGKETEVGLPNGLPDNPFFRQFFGNQFGGGHQKFMTPPQSGVGSGVIVTKDGYILTNNHVVDGAKELKVTLDDGREFKAKVVGRDPKSDVAVIKIEAKDLPAITFADSSQSEVGDVVLAIGNPFNVGQTVTMGIISATGRGGVGIEQYEDFIQTDAAINPGNSGGALVTTDGKLAGINTAIYSRSGGSVGIGFAIPANLARRVVEGALGGGSVKLAWIGADGQPVTAEIAQSIGLGRPGGVLLKNVFPGGPAANAGLRSGQVIESVDGTEVDDMQGLNYRIATHKAGDIVHVHVEGGGSAHDVAVTLGFPPETPPRQLTAIAGRNPLTGAKVENLSPAVAVDLQLDLMDKGVVVVSVAEGTISANQGFQPGDIIRSVNGAPIGSVGQLQAALNGAAHWDMIVQRGEQKLTLSVSE